MVIFNTLILGFFIPNKFLFTYVQTVLQVSFVSVDLSETNKDISYHMWAWIHHLPVVLFGWFEALSCDSFLVYYGGHCLYDAIIPMSILVFAVWELFRTVPAKFTTAKFE